MVKTKSYKELSAELEELLAWFESGEVDLDLAITKHQQALDLIKQLETKLKTAKNQVVKINSAKSS